MKYRAILFDFDGVIGKTMEDNYQAWSKAFGDYNISLGREEYFLLEGMNIKTVAKTILEKRKMNPAFTATISELKEKYYLNNNSFNFYPGVENLINSLSGRFKLGLVSGANLDRLKKTVPPIFLDKFEVIITGDKVRNPKPHPEPYLFAAEMLSVPPEGCMVVENAPLGIESAKSAGMNCVAICSTLDRKHLIRADFIVEEFVLLESFFKI